MNAINNTSFEYGQARVRDLQVEARKENQKHQATGIALNGESLKASNRFWTSFFHRFGVSERIFRYFTHDEVFNRIAQETGNAAVNFCIERGEAGKGTLLAVTNPTKASLHYEDAMRLVRNSHGADVQYGNGVVTSTLVPRSGDMAFDIGGDAFENRFLVDLPIDGWTQPRIHLSMLRQVCSNGMVAYSKVFRTDIAVGNDPVHSVARALNGFDNPDGYDAMRQRFEASQRSWASLQECITLQRYLARADQENGLVNPMQTFMDFRRTVGDLAGMYGLANLNALSTKRLRILPARCRVYDLLNFATEVATHHANEAGARRLQAYVGTLISEEYDLEGTAEQVTEFADFHLVGSAATAS
ncbi:MAG: DUF932 domain-containing protein [Bradymonadia bacterium]